jgi:hypothetical protein
MVPIPSVGKKPGQSGESGFLRSDKWWLSCKPQLVKTGGSSIKYFRYLFVIEAISVIVLKPRKSHGNIDLTRIVIGRSGIY